jgi:tRNA nucleotidyltransferase (CCA-adding enzyme)
MEYGEKVGTVYFSHNYYTTFFLCYNVAMDFVLTHEQADFDAIAALYAAALIGDIKAVLPRRVNRNVKAFITLYGLDSAFLDPRDLPEGSIESVTLVDTQSLVTLKGMGKETKIRVFDHHPERLHPVARGKGLPGDWEVVIFDLGATTTYFMEILQERRQVLTSSQATLFLLGIYEDTGALTYSNTKSRDVHAVGWLLDQGAELRSISDFLNPPLNQSQREVYERLIENIETIEINGHKILIACGAIENPTEEISILAHKLRDLFDPDALFVLVQTDEGIRFVARSTTDQIDVSLIANHFKGGGHSRAAAALIKRDSSQKPIMEVIRQELIEVLPKYIIPAITVGQIMSKRPHLINANTPIKEVAHLMARYGYEGFPVEDSGKLVGLLARRAVDRAISHQLNMSASSLMEAGNISVHPGDSLQRLQLVMNESGWGQVPVIEPETLKIIGIVTRTDLLKILSRSKPVTLNNHNYPELLRKILAPQTLQLIHLLADHAVIEHSPVYLVGGFVRDLLLNYPSSDFDIVVEGDAISLGKILLSKYGGRLTSHTRFGTARWYLTGSKLEHQELPNFLDLISARQEFYEHPSALPTVEHSSIKLDLHRRDFTINTLALRLDGRFFCQLHDYYGGLLDIERRTIRVLHSLSFIDDPTRMLRAIRYEQRYGFTLEPRTLQLMEDAKSRIAHLSPERIRHEVDLILTEKNAPRMLFRLDELGLIKAISEELPWNKELESRMMSFLGKPLPVGWDFNLPESDHLQNPVLAYCLWLLDNPLENIEKIHSRLTFQMYIFKAVKAASSLYSDLKSLIDRRPSDWVDRLDGMPVIAIYAVYLVSKEQALQTYVFKWRKIFPHTNGDTLRKRGLIPGRHFQKILHILRCAWVNGEINTPDSEEILLNQLLVTENK